MKQFSAAIAEAESGDPKARNAWLLAVAHAATGRVQEANAAFDRILADDDELDREETLHAIYDDPDLGPALQGNAFKAWREKHPRPVPATRPSTSTRPA